MRLDFRSRAKVESKPPVQFSPWFLRMFLLIAGLCLLLFFLFTLFSGPSAQHPYGVFLFSKLDSGKPQTQVRFVWIDEQKRQVSLVSLPDDLEYISSTVGTYPLSSVYAARSQSAMSDTDFIRDISFFFRIPVSGFIHTTRSVSGKLDILSGLTSFCLVPQSRSLSFSECLHLVFFTVHPQTALTKISLPDTVFAGIDSSGMHPLARDAYTQWRKRNLPYQLEGAAKTSIAVINVSGRSGAAGRVSSLFDDFGLHTLMVSDSKDKQDQGSIYVAAGKKDEEVVRFIADLLHLPVTENSDKTKESRADIVVVIGEKEAKAFTP
ncbi:MAG: LytR C-terminal domain-containing protein [Candidatus Woesebacteria bacterium]